MTSAIDKAITEFEILSSFPQYSFDYVNLIKELKACKEALAQPAQEVGDAEIKQMLDDIEYYQKRIEELEQPAQEPVAWMRSALDNARDVCKYLDHDMIKEAKAHTKFFWDDIEKIKEPDTHPAPQPAQEPVAWMSKKRGDVSKAKMYFNEGEEILPLYTHPAPSWQGLSDDDVHNYADHNFAFASEHFEEIFNFYRAIEQALKEKNYV